MAVTAKVATSGCDWRSWWRKKEKMLLHRCGVECEGKNHSDSVKATKMAKIEKIKNGAKPQCVMSAVSAFLRNEMAIKRYETSVESTQRDARKNNVIGEIRKARIVGIVVMGKKNLRLWICEDRVRFRLFDHVPDLATQGVEG